MKITKILIILLFFTGCSSNHLKSDYDIFINDYQNGKSYFYVLINDKLHKKYQYQSIIESLQKNKDNYYLQINKDFSKYLQLSNYTTSKKIDLKQEYPTVYHVEQQDVYYSSNYLNKNFLVKRNNINKVTKYSLDNYFINNILVMNNHSYLFLENQDNNNQKLLILAKNFKKRYEIKLHEKMNLNNNPFVYQDNIYYLSNKNNLIKITKSLQLTKLIKLKEKFPHQIIIDKNYLYYSNYDSFNQKQNNVLTKINLNNKQETKKYFKQEIIDIKLKNNKLLILNKDQLFILNTNLKQLQQIKFNLKKEAIKIE